MHYQLAKLHTVSALTRSNLWTRSLVSSTAEFSRSVRFSSHQKTHSSHILARKHRSASWPSWHGIIRQATVHAIIRMHGVKYRPKIWMNGHLLLNLPFFGWQKQQNFFCFVPIPFDRFQPLRCWVWWCAKFVCTLKLLFAFEMFASATNMHPSQTPI